MHSIVQFDQAVGFVQLVQTGERHMIFALHLFDVEGGISGKIVVYPAISFIDLLGEFGQFRLRRGREIQGPTDLQPS
jgi:hypothetical protein